MRGLRIAVLAAVVVLVGVQGASWAADDAYQAMERKAASISEIAGGSIGRWYYKTGEVRNGYDRYLGYTGWPKSDRLELVWGDQSVAWLRARVKIPSEVGGISVEGSSVTFKCGVDDDGIIYVNGKEVQRFHWDQGSAVLTEKAKPGDTFEIAIKGINTGGPGRLLFAELQYSTLQSVAADASAFAKAYRQARDLYALVDQQTRAGFFPIMSKAVAEVDLPALKAGKTAEFRASLQSAAGKLAGTNELMHGLTAHLVGHAHIDMNWLWLWPETQEVCKNTFTSMCDMMDKYPGFRFSQDQPATYLTMQETQPELFARIKEKVKSGQWEVTASNWTEGDNNMSSGESIVRSILYGKRYIKQQFGTETVVGWEPDNFGHPWTLPQILVKSGIKYYYFMRCNQSAPVFWWQGPDGSRVLAYSYGTYNGDVTEEGLARDTLAFCRATGLRDYMLVYGVGDHGGGPTRQMVETAIKLQSRTDTPRVIFGKAGDYYETIAKTKAEHPVWNNEINSIFEGCYTTHADIKKWNRDSEGLIPCAEKFASIAAGLGVKYPGKDFERAWRNTCFNQFHDILCGSAIHGSYDYSEKLYIDAKSRATVALKRAVAGVVAKIATNAKPGVPIVVFNPLSWTRTDAIKIATPFPGERTEVRITDETGKVTIAQTIGDELRFTARNVPAMGYKVFWLNRGGKPMYAGAVATLTSVENQFLKVTFDKEQGTIASIYDKINKRQVLPAGGKGALLQALFEDPHGMSAWNVGRIVKQEDVLGKGETVMMTSGPTKATISLDHDFANSHFVFEFTLYDAVPRLDIHVTADWEAVGSSSKPSPMMKLAFPTALKNPKATFEIPFGSITRPANGAEVVAQKWIDISEPGYGVSLLNDCKYGFDVKGSTMRATVLRAPYEPDPTPDLGAHEMTFSLYPHKGDWRAAGTERRAYELNEPLIARVVTRHAGSLPTTKSFLSISEPNIVVTALKKSEDDDSLILRFYETQGKACQPTIKLDVPCASVVETDLMERPIGKKRQVSKGTFSVTVGKHEIKTYKLFSQ